MIHDYEETQSVRRHLFSSLSTRLEAAKVMADFRLSESNVVSITAKVVNHRIRKNKKTAAGRAEIGFFLYIYI